MNKLLSFFSIFIIASLVFTSCYGPKKNRLQSLIGETQNVQQAEVNQLNEAKEKQRSAFKEERIDTTINNRLNTRLQQYTTEMDSLNNEIQKLQAQILNPKSFRKNYKDSIEPKIIALKNHMAEKDLRLRKYSMLNESIDISKQNPYGLAAFFGTGKYNIPEENYAEAASMFLPVIDSLIVFSNKYSDISSTSTVVVNGYADGQNIDTASELYNTLLQHLNKDSASKKQLNWALSDLRAQEIENLLDTLLQQNQTRFTKFDNVKFNYYGYGQGETYPSKKIHDYQEDDERRRIVLIYWSVIPD